MLAPSLFPGLGAVAIRHSLLTAAALTFESCPQEASGSVSSSEYSGCTFYHRQAQCPNKPYVREQRGLGYVASAAPRETHPSVRSSRDATFGYGSIGCQICIATYRARYAQLSRVTASGNLEQQGRAGGSRIALASSNPATATHGQGSWRLEFVRE